MRFYQEITLIKTPEITPYFIWSKVYMQVHLAFVEQQNPDETVNYGVSFPAYHYVDREGANYGTLGDKLRIFAKSERELEKLNLQKWLQRLADYVHIKSIQAVPDNITSHLLVKRYRAVTNLDRLTRRFMRRESKRLGREISFEEAKALQNERFVTEQNKRLSEGCKITLSDAEKHFKQPKVKELPFIRLESKSTQKEFSLQIEQLTVNEPKEGTFSTYGLSSQTTVPHW